MHLAQHVLLKRSDRIVCEVIAMPSALGDEGPAMVQLDQPGGGSRRVDGAAIRHVFLFVAVAPQ